MRVLISLFASSLLFAPGSLFAAEPIAKPMSFVFVVIDDLGWADLSCYGSTFHETPHLDNLAASGLRFTHAYAACPVCSPTRASIMTGRHPVRVDITDWIPGQTAKRDAQHRFLQIEDRNELPLDELTIAEVLHSAGYQTFFAGKWHLGGEGFLPTEQGFDVNLGGAHYGQPPAGYFAPWKNPWLKERRDREYLTERLTEESVSFLRHLDPSRPFLLFLSHYDVHTPIHKDEKHFDHFVEKAKGLSETPALEERRGLSRAQQDNSQYASMVSAIDDSVGEIVGALHEQGLDDSTTIIFTSDNGGLCTLQKPGPTCNLPLRSGKGWLYEGGIRVPLIIRSPLISRPGEICEQPVLSTDYFPTMIDMAKLELPAETPIDGMSVVPMFSGHVTSQTRPLAWHYPHYHGSEWTPGAAYRSRDWKLIEFYEYGDAELYNLSTDPGEQKNLAMENPEKLHELRSALVEWQRALNAKMPEPNPEWKPQASRDQKR